MRALVTGGSGFVGRAIVGHLRQGGAQVDVLGRATDADVSADLALGPPSFAETYDLVVHAAGKAHAVPRTAAERQTFHDVNAVGTRHLLDALDGREPEAIVLISTVAVYGQEEGERIHEDAALLATDPYGTSKIEAERIVAGWAADQDVRSAALRLPLVAGPRPPGNLGAMLRALAAGRYLGIGRGAARRSIVLADDVAAVVPTAAAVGGTYNLTDGVHPSFAEIEVAMAQALGVRAPRHLPHWAAVLGGVVGDGVLAMTGWRPPLTTRTVRKMTSTLTLSDDQARTALDWRPRPVLSAIEDWGQLVL